MRNSRSVRPVEVRVTALASNLALMTPENETDMSLKDGPECKYRHAFTMIWEKGTDGWRILHSHESWLES